MAVLQQAVVTVLDFPQIDAKRQSGDQARGVVHSLERAYNRIPNQLFHHPLKIVPIGELQRGYIEGDSFESRRLKESLDPLGIDFLLFQSPAQVSVKHELGCRI